MTLFVSCGRRLPALLALAALLALLTPAHSHPAHTELDSPIGRHGVAHSPDVRSVEGGHAKSEGGIEDSLAEASSITDVELVSGDEADDDDEDDEGRDTRAEGQHFFPSFASLFPPLGHSRPPASVYQEPPRAFTDNYRSTYSGEDAERVLGSGNFGVIRGGTYYSGSASDPAEDFYRGSGNNGHGRPYYRANPLPAYRHGGDFFAGFRDFADITTPTKSAFSQYVVVYAAKNGSAPSTATAPNNIFEQLALLDSHKEKGSKNKKKLALHKDKMAALDAKKKFKGPKDVYEPLLALS